MSETRDSLPPPCPALCTSSKGSVGVLQALPLNANENLTKVKQQDQTSFCCPEQMGIIAFPLLSEISQTLFHPRSHQLCWNSQGPASCCTSSLWACVAPSCISLRIHISPPFLASFSQAFVFLCSFTRHSRQTKPPISPHQVQSIPLATTFSPLNTHNILIR